MQVGEFPDVYKQQLQTNFDIVWLAGIRHYKHLVAQESQAA